MNRVDRLLAQIVYLQSKSVVTAEEIADHFGLSVRTIYRDIVALGEAGVPIVAEAGVGYSLMRGYYLPPVNFTSDEANALATGATLLRHTGDESLRIHVESALLKVRGVLPREYKDKLLLLEKRICVEVDVPHISNVSLALLQQAITYRRVLQFNLRSGSEVTLDLIVEALGLVFSLNCWQLVGWSRNHSEYRRFDTNQMEELRAYRDTFQGHDGLDFGALLTATKTMGTR